jgi:hypothetical protein
VFFPYQLVSCYRVVSSESSMERKERRNDPKDYQQHGPEWAQNGGAGYY